MLFVEKYRPTTIEDCILPDRIKTVFREYVKTKEIPHMLLHGSAGTGKCLDPNEVVELLVSDEIYERIKNL